MTDFKVLSDEEIEDYWQKSRVDRLNTTKIIAQAQFQYTIQQVVEMLDGIENRWDCIRASAFPHGRINHKKQGFDEAIQTIKAKLQEMERKE